ncbi:cation channel family protein [Cystoisospora suis]|uniref:Cation channel family protein n=1 Tax=Cystoisospora suis TaxID=483139 RepID=A0A2C6L9P9_9APIC|nr:cation channel family protein [Cystoisospora suis]
MTASDGSIEGEREGETQCSSVFRSSACKDVARKSLLFTTRYLSAVKGGRVGRKKKKGKRFLSRSYKHLVTMEESLREDARGCLFLAREEHQPKETEEEEEKEKRKERNLLSVSDVPSNRSKCGFPLGEEGEREEEEEVSGESRRPEASSCSSPFLTMKGKVNSWRGGGKGMPRGRRERGEEQEVSRRLSSSLGRREMRSSELSYALLGEEREEEEEEKRKKRGGIDSPYHPQESPSASSKFSSVTLSGSCIQGDTATDLFSRGEESGDTTIGRGKKTEEEVEREETSPIPFERKFSAKQSTRPTCIPFIRSFSSPLVFPPSSSSPGLAASSLPADVSRREEEEEDSSSSFSPCTDAIEMSLQKGKDEGGCSGSYRDGKNVTSHSQHSLFFSPSASCSSPSLPHSSFLSSSLRASTPALKSVVVSSPDLLSFSKKHREGKDSGEKICFPSSSSSRRGNSSRQPVEKSQRNPVDGSDGLRERDEEKETWESRDAQRHFQVYRQRSGSRQEREGRSASSKKRASQCCPRFYDIENSCSLFSSSSSSSRQLFSSTCRSHPYPTASSPPPPPGVLCSHTHTRSFDGPSTPSSRSPSVSSSSSLSCDSSSSSPSNSPCSSSSSPHISSYTSFSPFCHILSDHHDRNRESLLPPPHPRFREETVLASRPPSSSSSPLPPPPPPSSSRLQEQHQGEEATSSSSPSSSSSQPLPLLPPPSPGTAFSRSKNFSSLYSPLHILSPPPGPHNPHRSASSPRGTPGGGAGSSSSPTNNDSGVSAPLASGNSSSSQNDNSQSSSSSPGGGMAMMSRGRRMLRFQRSSSWEPGSSNSSSSSSSTGTGLNGLSSSANATIPSTCQHPASSSSSSSTSQGGGLSHSSHKKIPPSSLPSPMAPSSIPRHLSPFHSSASRQGEEEQHPPQGGEQGQKRKEDQEDEEEEGRMTKMMMMMLPPPPHNLGAPLGEDSSTLTSYIQNTGRGGESSSSSCSPPCPLCCCGGASAIPCGFCTASHPYVSPLLGTASSKHAAPPSPHGPSTKSPLESRETGEGEEGEDFVYSHSSPPHASLTYPGNDGGVPAFLLYEQQQQLRRDSTGFWAFTGVWADQDAAAAEFRRIAASKGGSSLLTLHAFRLFVTIFVILDVIKLGASTYFYPSNHTAFVVFVGLEFFVWIFFLAEALLKVKILGLRRYFKSMFNCFDCFILLVESIALLLRVAIVADPGGIGYAIFYPLASSSSLNEGEGGNAIDGDNNNGLDESTASSSASNGIANEFLLTPLHRGLLVLDTLQLFRVYRLTFSCRELFLLTKSILHSLRSLQWTALFVFCVIYTCAIFCTWAFYDADDAEMRLLWGNLVLSMFTLFTVLTLEGWNGVANATAEKHPFSRIFFVCFICFTTLTLLNIVTGIILDAYVDMSSRLAAEASYHEHLEKDARNEDILTKAFQQTDFLFSLPASSIAVSGGSSRCLSSSSSSSAYSHHCRHASSSSRHQHQHPGPQHSHPLYFQYPSYQLKSFSCTTDEETPCPHGSSTKLPPCVLPSSSSSSFPQQTLCHCRHHLHSPRKKGLCPAQALADCSACASSVATTGCPSSSSCHHGSPNPNTTPGETRETSSSSSSSSSNHLSSPQQQGHGGTSHTGVSTCCSCYYDYYNYCLRQQEAWRHHHGGSLGGGGGAVCGTALSTLQQERSCHVYSDSDRDILIGNNCRGGVCPACISSSSSQRGMRMCRPSASSSSSSPPPPPTTQNACNSSSSSSSSSPLLFGAPKLERKMTGLTSECSTTAPRATTECPNEGSGTAPGGGGRSTSRKKKETAGALFLSDAGACSSSSSSSSSVKGGEGEEEDDVEEGGRGGGHPVYGDECEMKEKEKNLPTHLGGASSHHGGGKSGLKNERKTMRKKKLLLKGGGGDHKNKKDTIDVDWDREEDDLEESGVVRDEGEDDEDEDDHRRLGRMRFFHRKRSSRLSLRGGPGGGRGGSSSLCSSCGASCLFSNFVWGKKKSQGEGCRGRQQQQQHHHHLLLHPHHHQVHALPHSPGAPEAGGGHEGIDERKNGGRHLGRSKDLSTKGEENLQDEGNHHDQHHHCHLQPHGQEEEETPEKLKEIACLNLSHLHPLDILQHPAVLDALEKADIPLFQAFDVLNLYYTRGVEFITVKEFAESCNRVCGSSTGRQLLQMQIDLHQKLSRMEKRVRRLARNFHDHQQVLLFLLQQHQTYPYHHHHHSSPSSSSFPLSAPSKASSPHLLPSVHQPSLVASLHDHTNTNPLLSSSSASCAGTGGGGGGGSGGGILRRSATAASLTAAAPPPPGGGGASAQGGSSQQQQQHVSHVL